MVLSVFGLDTSTTHRLMIMNPRKEGAESGESDVPLREVPVGVSEAPRARDHCSLDVQRLAASDRPAV